MRVRYDADGDFLEITFSKAKGYSRRIRPDVYERVDTKGRVLGVAVFNFMKQRRRSIDLPFEVRSIIEKAA
jgi:uncharacterized protein YuzE